MKHFDVEAYAKTMLGGMAIAPEDDLWFEISENIDRQYRRKRRRTRYIKIAVSLVLLFGIPLTIKKSNEGPALLRSDILIEEIDKLSAVSSIEPDVAPEVKSNPSKVDIKKKTVEKIQQIRIQEGRVQLASNEKFEKNSVHVETVTEHRKNSVTPEKLNRTVVTDAEIDSLVAKARQNLEMERALQREREALAHEMLADIKKEMETKNSSFYHDIKNGYAKLKTVIAN